MSGMMRFRVNRQWFNSTLPGSMNFRIFWELLHFFNDHPDISIISYGEGAVEQGSCSPPMNVVPTLWLPWGPAMDENAWFVVNANKGSVDLTGDGSRQWQLKIQVSNSSPYADTSGIDYGEDGNTGRVVCRFSPDGGWVGSTTRDFVAVTASDDMLFSEDNASDEDFLLHCAGDNETVVFYGQMKSGLVTPDYAYGRAGYFGQIVRRSSQHTKPEYAMVPRLYDAVWHAIRPCVSRLDNDWSQFGSNDHVTQVRSTFSIAANGDAVERHMHAGLFFAGTGEIQADMDPDPWSGDIEQLACMIRQKEDSHQSILGQLRHFSLISNAITEGSLTGNGSVLSIAYQTVHYVGVGFPWPGTGTPPLF